MFCSQCGKEIKPGASFCTNCGAKVKAETIEGRPVPISKPRAEEKVTIKVSPFPLICGVVMLISVFLPWASLDYGFGMKKTEAGTASGYGILCLIMGILCAGLSFLGEPKIRGIGHLASGILAIIGVAGYWSSVRSEVGMFREALSPEFGLFLCGIVAIVVVITGILELQGS